MKFDKKTSTKNIVATSVLTAALLSLSNSAIAQSSERCADIVKGGSNSCAVASLGISCQGNATKDNMVGAWIKVPTGACTNIVSICNESSMAPEGSDAKKIAKACDKIADQKDKSVVGGRLVDSNGESI